MGSFFGGVILSAVTAVPTCYLSLGVRRRTRPAFCTRRLRHDYMVPPSRNDMSSRSLAHGRSRLLDAILTGLATLAWMNFGRPASCFCACAWIEYVLRIRRQSRLRLGSRTSRIDGPFAARDPRRAARCEGSFAQVRLSDLRPIRSVRTNQPTVRTRIPFISTLHKLQVARTRWIKTNHKSGRNEERRRILSEDEIRLSTPTTKRVEDSKSKKVPLTRQIVDRWLPQRDKFDR